MLKGGGRPGIMHAIKGGWVGQTYALSKRNESGRRKSRLRISKVERKEMVESFIKKYQSSNGGNFPSLNLTHKEVGGSFYTIREIVREIIQENRVLGPARSLPEKDDSDKLFTQPPLGTISSEPEFSPSTLPNGIAFVSDQHQDSSEEHYLISKEFLHQGFNNSKIVNVTHALTTKERDETKAVLDQVSETLETKKSMEEVVVSRSKVTRMADVTVETFPLPSVTQPAYNLDGNSDEVQGLKGTSVEKDVKKVPLGPIYDTSMSDGMDLSDNSSLVDDKVKNPADSLLEGDSRLVDEKAMDHMVELQLEKSNSSATDGIVHDTKVDIDIEVKSSHNDMENAETKVVDAANDTQIKVLNSTHTNTKISIPISQQEAIQNKDEAQRYGISQKGSAPNLERIKIESWEGASKNPTKSETNPVVAVFKSIVSSFVKFWSG